MASTFNIAVKDWKLAQEIQEHVEIGHRFVFVKDGRALKQSGRLGRLLGYRAQSNRTVLALADAPVELSGVDIVPAAPKARPLACLVSDRDLYRKEQDTVHLFCAMPKSRADVRLSVKQNGAAFTERPVTFDDDGISIETLAMLLPGRYEAELLTADGPLGAKVSFTVAEYTLAPLSARLLSHELHRTGATVAFDLAVESYQVPYGERLLAAMMDGEREIDRLVLEPARPGRYSGKLKIDGEGPFRIQLRAADDAARVAEVVIPGSRKHEREVTRISELGREIYFSLMPEAGALPVRGGYLSEGDHLATPILVEEVHAAKGRLRVNCEVQSLVLAVADLSTGRFEIISKGDVKAEETVEVPLTSPISTVFVGCFVDGHPFEGYTSFIRRSALEVTVDAPKSARPGDEVEIRLRTRGRSGVVPCLLAVRDERLTAADTPQVALAASAKRGFSTLASVMEDDVAFHSLAPLVPPMPSQMLGLPVPMSAGRAAPPMAPPMMRRGGLGAPAAAPVRAVAKAAAQAFGELFDRARAEVYEKAELELAPELASESSIAFDDEGDTGVRELEPAEAPSARAIFPEVLFYGLVPVEGEARITLPLKDALTTYAIEVFALAGGDWAEAKTTLAVDQPVRIDLDVPPAVGAEDRVLGRLRAAGSSGRIQVRLTSGGEPVALSRAGGAQVRAGEVLDSPAELTFLVRPGSYVAEVTDAATQETDRLEAFVGVPGKFKSYVRQLAFVEKGERITLDSEGAVALRVLPAIDQPFGALLEATADYGHLCCEQTGAKILAAAFMYLSADAAPKKKKAEDIILAGVAREKSMWQRGRGFSPYPGHKEVAEYYGPKVVRYLWSLHQIAALDGISLDLRRGVREAMEMADDVARAIRMTRTPARIASLDDAYAVAASGERTRHGEVRSFVADQIDLESGELRREKKADPVTRRLFLAYGAAALLAIDDVAKGVKLANLVTREFNEMGRLYSTVDSIAAICLMVQLKAKGIGAGSGRVEVNGRKMETKDAAAASDQIEALAVLEGVALVEITRIKEEDWTSFSNDLKVTVGFRDAQGKKVTRFVPGDRTELLVQLGKGYKFGDLVHVSLPASMAWIQGGGRVKRFTVDFEGKDELRLPLVVTGAIQGKEHFAVCVRNMFEEARVTSPGVLSVSAA